MTVFSFIIDLLGKWVIEIVIGSIHNIYTFLLIALDAVAVAFIMQGFLKFNKAISWLTGLLVFIWLSEHIIIKRSAWSTLLVPSVVGLLFLILFIRMLGYLWKESFKKPHEKRCLKLQVKYFSFNLSVPQVVW